MQYEQVDVSFELSSVGKPKASPGDTFTLGLPDIFAAADTTFDLLHPDSTVVGSCSVTGWHGAAVTCTFNAAVADHTPIEGSVQVHAQVRYTTSSETVEFTVDDEPVAVDLPGEGGVLPEQPSYPPDSEKWGWFTTAERTQIYWVIYIHGDQTGSADHRRRFGPARAAACGTVVTLSEVALPQVAGIEWGTPVFSAAEGVELLNGGQQAQVTIPPQQTISVGLTNTATPISTPPPTPPTETTPPTTEPSPTPLQPTPPAKGGALAVTGADAAPLAGLAAALLLAGATILLAARRRGVS